MPVAQQLFLAGLGHPQSVVRLKFDFPVMADIGDVCSDGAGVPSAAGHFHHHFRHSSHGAKDLLDLPDC